MPRNRVEFGVAHPGEVKRRVDWDQIKTIIPASGHVVVYEQPEPPWVFTEPVVAWALVGRLENQHGEIVEDTSVVPLIAESELVCLELADRTSNIVALIRADDKTQLEALRRSVQLQVEKEP